MRSRGTVACVIVRLPGEATGVSRGMRRKEHELRVRKYNALGGGERCAGKPVLLMFFGKLGGRPANRNQSNGAHVEECPRFMVAAEVSQSDLG